MKRFIFPVLIFALALSPTTTRADTFTNFDFAGTFALDADPNSPVVATGTGTVLVNLTSGRVADVNITVTQNSGSVITFQSSKTGSFQGDFYSSYFFIINSLDSYNLSLYLPLPSLVEYGGGLVCSSSFEALDTQQCSSESNVTTFDQTFRLEEQFGILTPPGAAAETPEPSNLIFLITAAFVGAAFGYGSSRRNNLPFLSRTDA